MCIHIYIYTCIIRGKKCMKSMVFRRMLGASTVPILPELVTDKVQGFEVAAQRSQGDLGIKAQLLQPVRNVGSRGLRLYTINKKLCIIHPFPTFSTRMFFGICCSDSGDFWNMFLIFVDQI